MNMRKIYLVSAAMLMTAAVSFGQNFNPTVEVTNTYQGNASEVRKPLLGMNVPDSLLRFDLDFDYEVFEKPYQGAYSFKPYMLNMRPAKDAWRGRKLYLKAGAGYTLHPRFEFVFSPEQSGPFQMSVYASHKSYFGNYHEIKPELQDGLYRMKKSGGKFGGYDALTSAGFDGRYNWDRTILSFGIGYYGLAAKDSVMSRSYNAFDFNARVRSNNDSESYFLYDIGLRGRVANDGLDYKSFSFPDGVTVDKQNENWVLLDGLVGPVVNNSRSILVGFEAESASYSRFYDGNIGRVALIPSYRFKSGRWNLNLGVKLEFMFRNDADTLSFGKMGGGKGQIVYPDAHISFAAGGNVALYADATGGSRLNTYSSQISENHHLNPSFLVAPVYELITPLVDNTVEKVNARIGVRGSAASSFQFDVNGGVGLYGNALMESGLFTAGGDLVPALAYSDYNLIYANALVGLRTGRVKIDADFRYRGVSFPDKDALNLGFTLPKYSGGVRASYDISSRLYAGINVEAASWRDGKCASVASEDILDVRVPGYVDLGVNCGYKFNRKWTLWLESGNLLCQAIQRTPFYAEKGPWVTAGISLNL
jgi:hypothetical protein